MVVVVEGLTRAKVVAAYKRIRLAVATTADAGGKDAPTLAACARIPCLYKTGTNKKEYTVMGLCIVFFAHHLGEIKNKTELLRFLRYMKCDSYDPQPRHLGMQNGFNFLVQGCYHPTHERVLRCGEYCLLDLKEPHPSTVYMHRSSDLKEPTFSKLKTKYGQKCAVCGSGEGDRHLKNPHAITKLEKGHCDPREPLSATNCIPMCTLCNMVYKDKAVFNRRGFVVRWLPSDVKAAGARKDADRNKRMRTAVASKRNGEPVSAVKRHVKNARRKRGADAQEQKMTTTTKVGVTTRSQSRRLVLQSSK